MRNFGFTGYDEVAALGTNGKMSEACAAMGLTSLQSLDSFLAASQRNHEQFRDRLAGRPGLALVGPPPGERWNHHYAVVEIDAGATGLARDQLHRLLWAEGVLARKYFYPGAHAMAYRGRTETPEPPAEAGRERRVPRTRLMSLELA